MSFLAVRSHAHEGTGVCGCLGGLITVTVRVAKVAVANRGVVVCVCVCGVCVYFVLVDFARLFTDSTGLLQRRTGLNSHLAALKMLPMQWLPRVQTPNQTHRISASRVHGKMVISSVINWTTPRRSSPLLQAAESVHLSLSIRYLSSHTAAPKPTERHVNKARKARKTSWRHGQTKSYFCCCLKYAHITHAHIESIASPLFSKNFSSLAVTSARLISVSSSTLMSRVLSIAFIVIFYYYNLEIFF